MVRRLRILCPVINIQFNIYVGLPYGLVVVSSARLAFDFVRFRRLYSLIVDVWYFFSSGARRVGQCIRRRA
ncbi:hypothetical protein CLU79DRAFT_770747 [Phycomyces nitens]|nr:hypothetical protein CLU79DRAFT_770747 [Phycomyces nitens]